MRRIKKREP